MFFFTFWTVLGSILEGFGGVGEGFEGSKRLFFHAFLCARACNAKELRMCKTTVFPMIFNVFYISPAFYTSLQTTQHRSWSVSNRASHTDCSKNSSWGRFWRCLGLSWASFGLLLAALGRLQAPLGWFLGASWARLGRSWPSLGCSVEPLGCILAPKTAPGLDFRGFGIVQG